jgi:hypothetical protein
MRMLVEQLVEWRLAGETEVLGENLPQCHLVHHKNPHDQTRAWTPDRRDGKPATNRLSYGAAFDTYIPSIRTIGSRMEVILRIFTSTVWKAIVLVLLKLRIP